MSDPLQQDEEFKSNAGTYVKVVRVHEDLPEDLFMVLYLRPHGRFLFAGYWHGYEHSIAAGRWRREGWQLYLEGRGRLKTDYVPGQEGGQFERTFLVEYSHRTPVLRATTELKDWSLLGWSGDFVYVGQHTIIAADGAPRLPVAMSVVDAQIEELLAM
jgi:hypothetical protein